MNRAMLADILAAGKRSSKQETAWKRLRFCSAGITKVSLVLLDIVMPRMDNFEVTCGDEQSGWITQNSSKQSLRNRFFQH